MQDKQYMEKCWASGIGREPRTDIHNIHNNNGSWDLHVWLEDDEGNIIDRTPSEYQGKIHYKPFSKKEQTRIFITMLNDGTIKKQKFILEFLSANPQERNCVNNSYAYKMITNKKLKLVIGSAGFQFDNNRIFWAFG